MAEHSERVERLWDITYMCLLLDAPVLTGNLYDHIVQLSEGKIRVSGPSYNKFFYKKTGKMLHTYKVKDNPKRMKYVISKDFFDYAWLLNEVGAWGSRNKSMHWTNRAINNACHIYSMMLGDAEVVGELPE